MNDEMDSQLDDVVLALRANRLAIIAGAGVSIAATQMSQLSWSGLLTSALEHYQKIVPAPAAWADSIARMIASGEADLNILAAEAISEKLRAVARGNEFNQWLRKTFQNLRPRDEEILDAITSLDCPVYTTNYDDLLNRHISQTVVVDGHDRDILREFLSGLHRVMHLHGHWAQPETLVLGIRSYDKILADDIIQTIARALFLEKTVLFVGCGSGLDDPNFASLLAWRATYLGSTSLISYRLCLSSEVAELRRHHAGQALEPLSYGDSHDRLAVFLREIGTRAFAGRKITPRDASPMIPIESWMSLDRSDQWLELTAHCLSSRRDAFFYLFGDSRQKLKLFTSRAAVLLTKPEFRNHEVITVSPSGNGEVAEEWMKGLCVAISSADGTPEHLLLRRTRHRPLLIILGRRPLQGLSDLQHASLMDFIRSLRALLQDTGTSTSRHPVRMLLAAEFTSPDDKMRDLHGEIGPVLHDSRIDYVPMTEVDFPTWKDVEGYIRRQRITDVSVFAKIEVAYRAVTGGEHRTFEDLTESIDRILGRL